jgi:ribonuclease HI
MNKRMRSVLLGAIISIVILGACWLGPTATCQSPHHKSYDDRLHLTSGTNLGPGHLVPLFTHTTIRLKSLTAKFRAKWYYSRLEEKQDCIYRLPPPGNGHMRQTRIYDYLRPSDPILRGEQIRLLPRQTSTDMHSILQWNACSLDEEKALELSSLAQHHEATVLLISELGHRRTIPGFQHVVSDDRFTQSGIFIHASLDTRVIDCTPLENDRIAVQAAIIDEAFLILHPYIPPDTTINSRKRFWSKLERFCIKHDNIPIVIAGDLNTRSPLFSEHHNEPHEYLSQVVDSADLTINNSGEPTRGLNALDATLSNAHANAKIIEWQPLDALASDHLPCLTRTTFPTSRKLREKTKYEMLDIVETLRKLESILTARRASNPLTLEVFAEILAQSRKFKLVSPKETTSFWNDELDQLAHLRNRLRRRANHSQSREAEAAYWQSQKRFRTAFRKAKREHQRELVLEAAKDPTGSQGWSLLKRLAPDSRGRKKKVWITHSVKAKAEANEIARKFASICNDPSLTMNAEEVEEYHTLLTQLKSGEINIEPFSECELRRALKNSKSKAAPGNDGISYDLLKSCANNTTILKAMLEAYNHCLISQTFPEQLKHAKVRALPKDKPGDYRPISLLSTIGKIYDKMLEKRLREEFPLTKAQFGCRPGHSTSQALTRLLHASGTAAAADEHFGCISFDFSKAYDRVPRNLLVKKLRKSNISPYLILAIDDWLRNRSFQVSHRGSTSDTFTIENGIPQGSSLSVMLWLVFINDIPVKEDCANIYVDDTIIWARNSSKTQLRRNLTADTSNLMIWCSHNKVQVNLDKTKLLFNEHDPDETNLVCTQGVIPVNTSLRYLGVTLKSSPYMSNSSLQIDLETVAADIHRRCSILKKLRKYSIPQSLLERFIEGFVCGKLRYYTPFLGADAHENSEILKPLRKAYKELMRTETGAVRTTPIPLLQAGTRRPSLTNQIAADTTTMVMSSIANDNILGEEYISWNGEFDGWTPLGKAWEMLRTVAPDYESVMPLIPISRTIRDGMYKCTFRIPSTRAEAITLHSQNQLLIHSDIQLWTDGAFASSTEEGGAAFIVTERTLLESHASGLQQITSSYEAEREALRLGLLYLEKLNCVNKHIAIYTDSQGLARQLESIPLSYKTAESHIQECAEILCDLTTHNRVSVCWIPSHLGIGLNNEADQLARQGLIARTPPVEAPLPRLSSFRLRLKREIHTRTEHEISRTVKPSHFNQYPDRQLFIGGYVTTANGRTTWKRSPYTRKSRSERGIIFRLRSGHTRCQDHMRRIGIVESAGPCRLCDENTDETVDHFLLNCRAIQESLTAPLETLLIATGDDPPDFNSLCWTHPREVKQLLHAAERAGAWI